MTGAESRADVWAHLAETSTRRVESGMQRRLHPRAPDAHLIDVASNDYLSLARDPRLIAAAVAATERWGTGSGASRLVTGALELHRDLEQALIDLAGGASALLFSSGYLANLGVLSALADADTLVVSDAGNHASLIDGCRLAKAEVVVTGHLDLSDVERHLATRSQPRAMVVTDAVFSVDGRLAPVAQLFDLCRCFGAVLVVDEAHAVGVIGPNGAGVGAAAGIADEPDLIRTLTLSKSLGAQGGAVLADEAVVDALVNTARSMIFDTGLAPAPTAAALAAVHILQRQPDLPAQVRAMRHRLADVATTAGWEPAESDGAVLSLPVGSAGPGGAVRAQRRCSEHGVAVGCFRPPSVAADGSCLRLTARAGLSAADIAHVGVALAAARAALSASEESS